jgi:putative phage-type endonuclease
MDEQGTAEWKAERLGKVTASRIADLMAKTKTGWGASRANYRAQLVAERLTGTVSDSYTNGAMQWGTEMEPEARLAYELTNAVNVAQVGFIQHPEIEQSGASPDGLVGESGLVEIKCPQTATHIETLLSGSVPGKYAMQMQWQMACTGRLWCDFVSYEPRMPEDMRLWVCTVQRDDKMIADLEREVRVFLAEIDDTVAALCKRYRQEEAA